MRPRREARVGSRKRRNDAQRRAEGRVRGRVQQRTRGVAKRGTGEQGRKRITLGDIEGYANRLADRSGGVSGLAEAAQGLAGAASGLAGGSLASRLLAGDTSMPDEDFRREVAEHLALMEERLQRLEEQVHGPIEQDAVEENLPGPEAPTDPDGNL
jgi:hypothetical protein